MGLVGTINSGQANVSSVQPLDGDLTAISTLTTTTYGRELLTLADGTALRTAVGAASETATGVIELATEAEVAAGVDTTRAVTPAALSTAIDSGVAAGLSSFAPNIDAEVAAQIGRNRLDLNSITGATYALSAAGAGTSLGGSAVQKAALSGSTVLPIFRWTQAHPVQAGGSYPDELFVRGTELSNPTGALGLAMHFHTNASNAFEIICKGAGTGRSIRVELNGQPVTVASSIDHVASGAPADGDFYRHIVNYPADFSLTNVHVTVQGSGFMPFGAVVPSGGTITICPCDLGPRVIVVGDSFTEPTFGGEHVGSPYTGYSSNKLNHVHGFSQRMAKALGWLDVWDSGVGGQGYVSGAASDSSLLEDRIASDVVAFDPAIVIWAVGINDTALDPADVGAAAAAAYAEVATGVDRVQQIVVGPWWPNSGPDADVLAVNAAIKEAALAAGLPFIDPIGEGWVTADNQGWVTGTDSTHPTVDGHAYLGNRLAARIRAVAV